MKNDVISASVVVPTRNRCNNLKKLVDNIRKQSYPKDKLEIIIVDNGSTDSTRQAVDELIRIWDGPPIKYVFEPSPGYHNAVNRGALEAKNDIIVMVDDDILFEKDYLETLLEVYQDKEVGCAGGRIIALWEGGIKPDWIENHEDEFNLDYRTERRFIYWPQTIWGASFSVRRELFYQVGGHNPSRVYGGDGETGLCKKIYDIGGKIMWVPDAVVWHAVSAKVITHSWMRIRFFQQGKCEAYTTYRSKCRVKVSSIVRFFVLATVCQLLSYKLVLLGKNYRPRQWLAAYNWGKFLFNTRLFFDKRWRAIVLNDDHLTPLIEKNNLQNIKNFGSKD